MLTALLSALLSIAILASVLDVAPLTAEAASTPAIAWNKTYGGDQTETVWSAQQTSDGGYIMGGRVGLSVWLGKANSTGDMEWTKIVYAEDHTLSSIRETIDRGYIFAGTDASGDDGPRLMLVKTNSAGSIQWSKTYGEKRSDAQSVRQTRDGGYIAAGSFLTSEFDPDFYVVKTDSAGNMQWSKTYRGAGTDIAYSVEQTSDGGYVISGYTSSSGLGGYDAWLVKTGSAGELEWAQTYGGSQAEYAYSAQQTRDGGYVFAGSAGYDAWVVRANSTGGMVWSKTFGGTDPATGGRVNLEFRSVRQTSDGGCILGGLGSGSHGGSLVKVNFTGDVDWSQNYVQKGIYAVQETADGGYMAAGTVYSGTTTQWDFWLMKLVGKDADGDGLLDDWEKNGIDYPPEDGLIDLDLKALGADWQHKDLFVEVDYMGLGHRPDQDAVDYVVAAFANAPVDNPDSMPGIKLHIDLDDQIPHQDVIKAFTDFDSVKSSYFGTAAQRSSPNSPNILDAKKLAYHYCLFVHQYSDNHTGTWVSTSSSGIAECPGNDFIVSLGKFTYGWGTRSEQAATFMHELGHNLNLRHGGEDNVNYKPNYLSIMSYSFQFADPNPFRPLDYSRGRLPTLYEGSLDEPLGIQAGPEESMLWKYTVWNDSKQEYAIGFVDEPLDWNGDGDEKDYLVRANINNFTGPGWGYNSSADEVLVGYDDWANIKLDFRDSVGFADGVHSQVVDHEMTWEAVEAMRESVLHMHEVAVFNITSPSTVWSQGSALTVKLTLGNLGGSDESVSITVYANSTIIATSTLTVKAGNLTTATLPYTGQALAPGTYTLKAAVSQVAGETYTADNTVTGGTITVTDVIPEFSPILILTTALLLTGIVAALSTRKNPQKKC